MILGTFETDFRVDCQLLQSSKKHLNFPKLKHDEAHAQHPIHHCSQAFSYANNEKPMITGDLPQIAWSVDEAASAALYARLDFGALKLRSSGSPIDPSSSHCPPQWANKHIQKEECQKLAF